MTAMNQLGRCINSAAETFKLRAGPSNLHALEDIASDLKDALKAVRELIDTERKDRNGYHEMDAVPANWTRAAWKTGKGDTVLLNKAARYKWSGTADPPAIGAKVMVYMNGFGNGTVVGYFSEFGWLGVLVAIHKPPKWWIDQTKAAGKNPKATPGHFFGIDLEPRKMKMETA